ncbi:MAG: Fpg/Nei family DNA glycosylase [Acidobacteriales bacterium]|nr:Fpg/Nei family DNA glycosylase [Terriglobales bacterium]
MPEGDTIYRAARTLQRALGGQVVTRFETVLPQLARINVDSPILGRTVEEVTASGKWLQIHFSGGLSLLTHMLMNGSWHIYRPGEPWQRRRDEMRVLVATEKMVAVGFRIPIAEFHTEDSLSRRDGYNRLGPQVLAPEFDEHAARESLRSRPELEVAVALLNQSVLAGLGNVFKSEVCFAARVNPFRLVASLSENELSQLVSYSRRFMLANVTDTSNDHPITYTGFRRTTGRADSSERLWVYKRAGQPCRRCREPIEMQKQGVDARVTFWCPRCQPR